VKKVKIIHIRNPYGKDKSVTICRDAIEGIVTKDWTRVNCGQCIRKMETHMEFKRET